MAEPRLSRQGAKSLAKVLPSRSWRARDEQRAAGKKERKRKSKRFLRPISARRPLGADGRPTFGFGCDFDSDFDFNGRPVGSRRKVWYSPGAHEAPKKRWAEWSSPRQSGAIVSVASRRPTGMCQPCVEFIWPWQARLARSSEIELMLARLLTSTTALKWFVSVGCF